MNRPIYLDYAATTPIDPRVLDKMMPYLTDKFGNAHSRDHSYGWDAAQAVEEARYHVANLVNATEPGVVFTGSATESINLAIKGTGDSGGSCHVLTTTVEHDAVLKACDQLPNSKTVLSIPVDANGAIELSCVREALQQKSHRILSVMHANNEVGMVYPISDFARLAREYGALFLSDATQSVGKIPVDMKEMGIDLLSFSAHKIYGPKGVGALVLGDAVEVGSLVPLISGGGQERIRSGTLDVAGIVGFGEACRLAKNEMASQARKDSEIRKQFESEIGNVCETVINGVQHERLPGISNIRFVGHNAREFIRSLGSIALSTRSACSGSDGPSHVLKAMGQSDGEAYSAVRFSFGRFSTLQDLTEATQRISSLVR